MVFYNYQKPAMLLNSGTMGIAKLVLSAAEGLHPSYGNFGTNA
jgi:hypothetical protein